MNNVESYEPIRLMLQDELDSQKSQSERNKLGQFATDTLLSYDILSYAKQILPIDSKINFFDPAFGTGSFYSSLLRLFPKSRIKKAMGYEIDPHYGLNAKKLWNETNLKLCIEDFTKATPPASEEDKVNLLICNPPYVRHHHIPLEEKKRLAKQVEKLTHIKMNGLAGLYCYYLCLAHPWMSKNCVACWLIPSEFMDVKYGRQLKEYLTKQVTLIHIHRFEPEDLQFRDALVSSSIIWLKNEEPPAGHRVKISYGGPLTNPKEVKFVTINELRNCTKWTALSNGHSMQSNDDDSYRKKLKLSDLFYIKRGVATGDNNFFILDDEQVSKNNIPSKFLIPILPSPRFLKVCKIDNSAYDEKKLKRLFLLSCDLPEHIIKEKYPALWKYYQKGMNDGVNSRYLCKNRALWYSQEKRPAPLYLCTYMGRNSKNNKNFRFILNDTDSIATNSYLLLYPKPPLEEILCQLPELKEKIWVSLNNISQDMIKAEGRVYGGGLYKIEPKELNNVQIDSILSIIPSHIISRILPMVNKNKQNNTITSQLSDF